MAKCEYVKEKGKGLTLDAAQSRIVLCFGVKQISRGGKGGIIYCSDLVKTHGNGGEGVLADCGLNYTTT